MLPSRFHGVVRMLRLAKRGSVSIEDVLNQIELLKADLNKTISSITPHAKISDARVFRFEDRLNEFMSILSTVESLVSDGAFSDAEKELLRAENYWNFLIMPLILGIGKLGKEEVPKYYRVEDVTLLESTNPDAAKVYSTLSRYGLVEKDRLSKIVQLSPDRLSKALDDLVKMGYVKILRVGSELWVKVV